MPLVRLLIRDLPPPVKGLDVYGAVQVRRDVEQITRLTDGPMDLTAEFETLGPNDGLDFRGPYVQGRRGDRFIYISWGLSEDAANFGMYRRAKVILDEIPPELLDGLDLVATIDGTSADGGPVCARIRPESIEWTRGT